MLGVSNYTNFSAAGTPDWKLGQAPNWRGGPFDGWRHVRSSFAVDFRRDQATRGGENIRVDTGLDVSRASSRLLEDKFGQAQTFGANELTRLDGIGAFIGGTFVNKVRNSRGEGGVVGTVGAANKCIGYNAAPPALVMPTNKAAFNAEVSSMIAAGSTAGLFGIVDQTAALEAAADHDPIIRAGLDNGWLNGRVFKIVGGSGDSILYIKGTVGNLNKHSASMYGWVEDVLHPGEFQLPTGSPVSINATTPTRFTIENVTPDATDRTIVLKAPLGCTLYVILFDLVEAPACPLVPTVVAGAGATGSLPTDWANRASAGLSLAFLGVGTEDGLPYTDLRYAGAANSGGVLVQLEGGISVGPGDAWGMDFGVKLIDGACPDMQGDFELLTSGGTYIADRYLGGAKTPSGIRQTVAGKMVISDATAAEARPQIYIATVDAGTYDFIIRAYAPKMVPLAVIAGPPDTAGYLPDFPILPAAGLVEESSCAADIIMAPAPAWSADIDPAISMSELVAVDLMHVGDGVVRPLFEISDGTEDNSIKAYIDEDDQPTLRIVSGGSMQVTAVLGSPVAVGLSLLAFGWSADGGYVADQSGNVAVFGAVTLPSVLDHQQLGGDISTSSLNDMLVQVQTCSLLSLDEVQSWMEHEDV